MASAPTSSSGSTEPEQPFLEKVKDLISILSTFSDECSALPYTALRNGKFTKTKEECRTMHTVLHDFAESLRSLVSLHGIFYGSSAAKGDDRGVRELEGRNENLEKLKAKMNQQVQQEHPHKKVIAVRSQVETQLSEFGIIRHNMEERLKMLPPLKPEPLMATEVTDKRMPQTVPEKPTEVSDKKKPKREPKKPTEVFDKRSAMTDIEVVKILILFGLNVLIFRNSLVDFWPELLATALSPHLLSLVQWFLQWKWIIPQERKSGGREQQLVVWCLPRSARCSQANQRRRHHIHIFQIQNEDNNTVKTRYDLNLRHRRLRSRRTL